MNEQPQGLELGRIYLVVVQIAREVDMVNPDVVRLLNADGISSVREHLLDLDVTNDHVRLFENTKTDTAKDYMTRP